MKKEKVINILKIAWYHFSNILKLFWMIVSELWIFHIPTVKNIKEELGLLRWKQAIGVYNTMKMFDLNDPQEALKRWVRLVKGDIDYYE